MNFRIITKNRAADSKIGSPEKIDFRAVATHESHPTAWELRIINWETKITYNVNLKFGLKYGTLRS